MIEMKLLSSTLFSRLSSVVTMCCMIVMATLATTRVEAQQAYGLRAGDSLRIEVLEDPSLNRIALIAPDGRISFPQAGTLRVSGRTVDAVQSDLIARLTPSFASPPTVFVSIEKLAERVVRPFAPAAEVKEPVISVYVVGEANKLGKIDVAPDTTVLQMFAIMGGFTKFAATKRVQLRRPDVSGTSQVYTLNYPQIEAGLVNSGQSTMADGDVIVVPQRRLFE